MIPRLTDCPEDDYEAAVPQGAFHFEAESFCTRLDFRRLPVGTPTSYGAVIVCPRCGKTGAHCPARGLVVHLAWADGEMKMVAKSCPKGAR